jgi:hypothetical protein
MMLGTVLLIIVTVIGAVLALLWGILSAVWNAVSTVLSRLFSLTALLTLATILAVIALGLFPILAPNSAMDGLDAAYETVIFPAIDGTVTFVLHPIRDFIMIPIFVWWNDLVNYRFFMTFEAAVDATQAIIASAGRFTVHKFSDIVDTWFDWLFIDVMYSPTNSSDFRWGPARVSVPFVHWVVKSVNSIYAEELYMPPPVPPLGSTFILKLKNLVMTYVRLDVLSLSCYFQHFLTYDDLHWALEGCWLFDTGFCPNITDHLERNCTGCHNTSSALIDAYATVVVDGWAIIARELVEEIAYVVHSFDIDACAVLDGATCDATATYGSPPITSCACVGFNCSALPWWVRPPSILGGHCPEGQLQPIGLPLFGGPDCLPLNGLLNQCGNPSAPNTCAIVSESSKFSYVFRGKTCLDVHNAGGAIALKLCVDKPGCIKKDWVWWLGRVTNVTADQFVDAFRSVGQSLSCEWDYLRGFFAVIVLFCDPTCVHGAWYDRTSWISFLQTIFYRLPPIANTLICITPFTDWMLQSYFLPLSTGLRDGTVLWLKFMASFFDGSILTRSCFYCTAMREPDRNCAFLARMLDVQCVQDNSTIVRFTNANCDMVGFQYLHGNRWCSPLPCNTGGDICNFFAGSQCWDRNISDGSSQIPAMDIQWTSGDHTNACAVFDSGNWSIASGPTLMFGQCNTFRGCNSTNCHRYTRAMWQILNVSVYETSYNLLRAFTVSRDDAIKVCLLFLLGPPHLYFFSTI